MPEWQMMLGPAGALVLAVIAVAKLWAELAAARSAHQQERATLLNELDQERAARLEDARQTADALLEMQGRVLRAVEAFRERPCLLDTTRRSVPGAERS